MKLVTPMFDRIDAVRRMHALGWSVERIAADPRVKMAPHKVEFLIARRAPKPSKVQS